MSSRLSKSEFNIYSDIHREIEKVTSISLYIYTYIQYIHQERWRTDEIHGQCRFLGFDYVVFTECL